MPSLKQTLTDAIRQNNYLSINEIYRLADEYGCKRSNAERRLRPSESPNIKAVSNKRGATIGYRWLNKPKQLNLI